MNLNDYLSAYLGELVTELNVSASAISFAASEAIAQYPADTEDECTDINRLYALAKVEIWKRLMFLNSGNFDVSSDGQSYKTSQIYEFLKNNYLMAVSDAAEYLDNNEVVITSHRFSRGGCHEEFGRVC
jgi:hypothetical protein